LLGGCDWHVGVGIGFDELADYLELERIWDCKYIGSARCVSGYAVVTIESSVEHAKTTNTHILIIVFLDPAMGQVAFLEFPAIVAFLAFLRWRIRALTQDQQRR
jgi:hypothetical protein